MAGKDKDKKKDKNKENEEDEKDKKGEGDGDEEPSALAGSVGLGLIGSLIVGFDPLRDAFQGNGSFENAVMRFLACVAVCVIGASMLGRLIDASAPTPEELAEEEAARKATSDSGSDAVSNSVPGSRSGVLADADNAISETAGRQDNESNV